MLGQTEFLSYRRLVVGFSGGLDSTVLLHLLASMPMLFHKLHAVHVHHGLSIHADIWVKHCETFCSTYHIPFTAKYIQLETTSNLEEVAREARYAVFNELIEVSDCLLLAHHQDDQAETVLFNLLRGTGIEGLAAMPAKRPFGCGYLARPLLHQTRETLHAYAKQHALAWIEDDSNQNVQFSRNYLRHEILPQLKSKWPNAVHAITTCARHAQIASQHLEDLAYLDCPDLKLKPRKLGLRPLYDLPIARLNQVLRVWFKQQKVKVPTTRALNTLVKQVIFARMDARPCLQLNDVLIRRYRDALYMIDVDLIPTLPEITKNSLEARGILLPEDGSFSVRFRCGGEQMLWHGHTRTLKKMFQMLSIPPWLRDTVPLIFVDNTLAAILDFAIADGYRKLA